MGGDFDLCSSEADCAGDVARRDEIGGRREIRAPRGGGVPHEGGTGVWARETERGPSEGTVAEYYWTATEKKDTLFSELVPGSKFYGISFVKGSKFYGQDKRSAKIAKPSKRKQNIKARLTTDTLQS